MEKYIKKAKFANDFANRIKNTPGVIPSDYQMEMFDKEVKKRFDDKITDTKCPWCLTKELEKQVADDFGFNNIYTQILSITR